MANKIVLKKSSVASKVPLSTDLEVGEIAVNLTDQKLYSKKSDGTVILVGSGVSGGGDVVGPASATDNAIARFDSTTGKLIQNSTVTIDDNGTLANVNAISLDTTPTTPPTTAGSIYWDEGNGTPSVVLSASTELQLGQENIAKVYNGSGATIPNGAVVAVNGAQGQRPQVTLADADSEPLSAATLGIATESIANGAEGFICTFGLVRGVDTSGFTEGLPIYLSQTAGQFTQTRPSAPAHTVALGWVIKVNASSGEVFVNINNGWELDELHNVLITSPTSGNTLIYDATAGVWENANITAGTGISVTNGAGSITVNNTGVTSVSGTGTVNGLTLSGTVTTTGSLTLGGTPSGTWGISVTGNAGTVTNGVYTTGDQTIAGNKTFTGIVNGTFESSNARFKFKAADADGGIYALIGLDWGGTAGTYKNFEVYDYVNGRAMFRSFGATRNFEAYGAITSGSNLGFRNDVYYVNARNPIWSFGNAGAFGLSYLQGTAGRDGVDNIVLHPNGDPSAGGASFAITNAGNAYATASFRAPIFYDTNDTAYYIDAASTSRLNQINPNNIYFQVANPNLNASSYFVAPGGAYFNSGTVYCEAAIQARGGISNDTGAALTLNGGTGGYTNISGSARSPIFYDSNNTGYYVDPASSSSLNQINGRSTTNLMYYQGFTLDANTMDTNATGFTYSVNAPYTGPIIRISTGGGYDLQFNATYGGVRLAYRARNGDIGSWYPWSVVTTYGSYAGGDLYAARFYDGENSAYYCDPNGRSIFASLRLNTNEWMTDSLGFERIRFTQGDGTMIRGYTGSWYIQMGSTSTTTTIVEGAGNFYTTGAVTAYWSDKRLKKNIEKINDWREILSKINGYRFEWNDLGLKILGDSGDQERGVKVGVIAQEAKEALPQSAVVQLMQYENKVDGVLIPKKDIDYDPENPYLTVQLEKYIPVLIEASKGLMDENEQLKATIQSLVGRIAALEQKGV